MAQASLFIVVLIVALTSIVHGLSLETDRNIEQLSKDIMDHKEGVEPFQLTIIGGREYFISSNTKLTWIESTKMCNSLGMKLLSLETPTENIEINDYLSAHGHRNQQYWTSGQKISQEWLWTGIGQMFSYFDWRRGEPDNTDTDVGVGIEVGNGWWDLKCKEDRMFICEN